MTTLKLIIDTISQLKYNKRYDDYEEDARRFEIYKQKMYELEEHNEKYRRGELTFSVGVNQFTDMTDDEFSKHNLGLGAFKRKKCC